jgi:hypothetical protein
MEKVHQTQQQNPEMQQRYLNIQISEEKKLMKEHISHAQETEHGRVNEREEREHSRDKDSKREKGNHPEHSIEDDGTEEALHGMHVDIKV